jgi:acyl-CoA thioesterase
VVAAGYAKARMEIRDCHLNGANIVHGGAIFTLADFAFAAAANSHERISVGINAAISYAKAATTGSLTAEAKEVSLNHKLGNYIVQIRDEQNDLIAFFQGTVYRKKEKHQEVECESRQ